MLRQNSRSSSQETGNMLLSCFQIRPFIDNVFWEKRQVYIYLRRHRASLYICVSRDSFMYACDMTHIYIYIHIVLVYIYCCHTKYIFSHHIFISSFIIYPYQRLSRFFQKRDVEQETLCTSCLFCAWHIRLTLLIRMRV